MDEELDDAAARELSEETGLCNVKLEQIQTFGGIGRDPRGRQITIVFFGFADERTANIKAGDDAAEAKWFEAERPPVDIAFDHNKILEFALARLKETKSLS